MKLIQNTYYKIYDEIDTFFFRIKNVFRWLPIIWRDQDWDKHYLYTILYFKLKNMEEFFRSENTHIAEAENIAKEIQIAKILAKRLADEVHLENAIMWHDKIYERPEFEEMFKDIPGSEYSLYVGDPDKERGESFYKCCRHSDYMEQRDKEYLFDHMKKKINRWWD